MRKILIFLAGFMWCQVLSGQQWQTDRGTVVFTSEATFNSFSGTSEYLNGIIDFASNQLDFYLDLNTLRTGIKLRDKHMRDNYLETAKYPYAEFTGSFQELPSAAFSGEIKVAAEGVFKVHGVTKPVLIEGTLIRGIDGNLTLRASFGVLLLDYDIVIPKILGYELAELQKIEVNATLEKSKP